MARYPHWCAVSACALFAAAPALASEPSFGRPAWLAEALEEEQDPPTAAALLADQPAASDTSLTPPATFPAHFDSRLPHDVLRTVAVGVSASDLTREDLEAMGVGREGPDGRVVLLMVRQPDGHILITDQPLAGPDLMGPGPSVASQLVTYLLKTTTLPGAAIAAACWACFAIRKKKR